MSFSPNPVALSIVCALALECLSTVNILSEATFTTPTNSALQYVVLVHHGLWQLHVVVEPLSTRCVTKP